MDATFPGEGRVQAPAAPGPGWGWLAVCRSAALHERGLGVRFEVPGSPAEPGFAVRFEGRPRAYLNRCGHVPVELDWQEGRFFDDSGLYLVCATHGALYRPADGSCAGGPCRGRGLVPLQACEHEGMVWVAIRQEER